VTLKVSDAIEGLRRERVVAAEQHRLDIERAARGPGRGTRRQQRECDEARKHRRSARPHGGPSRQTSGGRRRQARRSSSRTHWAVPIGVPFSTTSSQTSVSPSAAAAAAAGAAGAGALAVMTSGCGPIGGADVTGRCTIRCAR
jgi:hypothetical protein